MSSKLKNTERKNEREREKRKKERKENDNMTFMECSRLQDPVTKDHRKNGLAGNQTGTCKTG
jgi:hypothetical protein